MIFSEGMSTSTIRLRYELIFDSLEMDHADTCTLTNEQMEISEGRQLQNFNTQYIYKSP